MVAEGIICDFTDKTPGASVTRNELATEAERHSLGAGEYLIFHCGMTPRNNEEYIENYAYPEVEAAEYIVEKKIASFATDALSADTPSAPLDDERVYFTLLTLDIPIIEDVANLSAVSGGRCDIICTPIPYKNRDESQVRFLVRLQ